MCDPPSSEEGGNVTNLGNSQIPPPPGNGIPPLGTGIPPPPGILPVRNHYKRSWTIFIAFTLFSLPQVWPCPPLDQLMQLRIFARDLRFGEYIMNPFKGKLRRELCLLAKKVLEWMKILRNGSLIVLLLRKKVRRGIVLLWRRKVLIRRYVITNRSNMLNFCIILFVIRCSPWNGGKMFLFH